VPLDQGGYSEIFNNMNAAINTGELPDLAIGYNNQYLSWDAAGDIIVDLNDYMDDPDVGFTAEEQADFYQTFFNQDVIGGRRLGLPAQRSGQYMFYNITWAQELGFDSPPTTPDEFYEQSCAAAAANGDGTGGWFIHTDASAMSSWIWAFGGEVENPDGGYYFDTPEAQSAFEFLHKLYADGCAWSPENSYPNPEFATRQGLFYTSSVAGYPYQVSAMEDAGNTDEWTMIPYPSLTGDPVVNLYGPSIAMVSSTPEEQLASWLFLKFWLDAQTQATWIGGSAYFPTRASAEDALDQYAADNPIWAEALSFRDYGKVEPRFESWSSVRYALSDAAALLFQEGFDPATIPQILADLQATADELHAETQP
jgi:ABC-type glycerol-3-phosphate transport system substrate-binding protein